MLLSWFLKGKVVVMGGSITVWYKDDIVLYISSDNCSDIVYFPCPICNNAKSKICLIFKEDTVLNCQLLPTSPTFPVICYTCDAIMQELPKARHSRYSNAQIIEFYEKLATTTI